MRIAMRIATPVLLLLGVVYYFNGVHTLLSSGTWNDLHLRWNERRMLADGVNPYDLSASQGGLVRNPAEQARLGRHGLEKAPAIMVSGYPPWGIATAFVLIPPGPFAMVRIWYIVLSTAALAVAMAFAYRLGRSVDRRTGWFLLTTVFAMFGNASTLRLGQYGLILNAAMIIAFIGVERGRHILPGTMLAITAMKPSYSLLQLGLMVLRFQWAIVALITLSCLAGSVVAWRLTGVDPLEMIGQMLRQSGNIIEGDTSLAGVARLFVAPATALPLLGIAGLIATTATGWRYRADSILLSCSIAAIAGRLCTYHRQYDNVMLLFPLIGLAMLACTTGRGRHWAIFAIFALSLWLPIPHAAYRPAVVLILSAIWIGGGIMLCRNASAIPHFSTRSTS